MSFKKNIAVYIILFCSGIQHASHSPLAKKKLPFPSSTSSILSPKSDSTGSSGYEADYSTKDFESSQESQKITELTKKNETLTYNLKTCYQHAQKLAASNKELVQRNKDLARTMQEKEECHCIVTGVFAAVTFFVATVCCLSSSSCDKKINSISDKSN